MIIHRSQSRFPILATPTRIGWFLVFLAIGCSPSKPKDTKQKSIQVLLQNAPESLDPRFAMSAYAATASELVYAPLVQIGEGLKPQPLLAQTVEQKNATTYLITLRPGLFFHDESPLTAQDVVYTFRSLLDPHIASPQREKFNYIQTVQADDDFKVTFTLRHPYAPFVSDLASIGILPQRGGKTGSGPFRVLSWDRTTNQITLAPHAKWFEGAPRIERLLLKVVKDPTTRLLELMKGNADLYVGSILPKQLDALKARAPELTISVEPGLGYSYLAMNLRGPKKASTAEARRTLRALANQKVRTAIAHAINIDDIIKHKFLGLAVQASGLLPQAHWAKDPQLRPIPYDPQIARKMLDEADFFNRGSEKGGRFHITISTTTDRFRQSLAQIIAASLNNVGIQTTVRVQDWGALFEDIKQGNFEMFSAKWLPVVEPDLLSWVFHSANIPAEGRAGGNRGAYRNTKVDALLSLAKESSNSQLRRSLYMEIENILMVDLPYIPLWFEDDIVIQSPRLRGYTPSTSGSLLGLRFAHVRS